MTAPRPVRCDDEVELSEYAAGRLSLERARDWDRHLVACRSCGALVAEERRLREALAGGPSMPGDLRLSLLALGRTVEEPAAPFHEPLTLLAPSAPPCHRSPLKATVVAAAAAGVSAAAAWSLTVIGTPVTPAGSPTPIAPVVAATGSAEPAPAGPSAFVAVRWTASTPRSTPMVGGAESTP